MRYIRLLFVVFVMYISWVGLHAPLTVSEETHIDIQDDIKLMITDTMQKFLPGVKDLRFDRFWTQSLNSRRIRAFFTFSFENEAESEAPVRYGIEGHAILNYDDARQIWDVEGPYFKNNQIIFQNGVTIRPGAIDGE